jgi:acetoin utilization protein AcuB
LVAGLYEEEIGMNKPSGPADKVSSWMTSPVKTVKPLDPVTRARELLEENRINQLAVVEDRRLVGIVTDRDLRDAFPSILDVLRQDMREGRKSFSSPEEVSVEMVMTANPLTLHPDTRLAEAVRLLRRERIGAVPIVEDHRLVGILTRSDLLEAYLAALEPQPGGGGRSVAKATIRMG